jgi:enoyl-CoA hydratase/carnithine racemase
LDALGLFESLVNLDDWAQTLSTLVQDVLALAPLALQETKKSLNEIAAGAMDKERLREREQMTSRSADFAEGRAAFAERRKPVFVGR